MVLLSEKKLVQNFGRQQRHGKINISCTHRLELHAEVADFHLQLHLVLLELGCTVSRLFRLVLQLGNANGHLTATIQQQPHRPIE